MRLLLPIIAIIAILALAISLYSNKNETEEIALETMPVVKPISKSMSAIPMFKPEPKPVVVEAPQYNTIDIVIMPGDTLAKRFNEHQIPTKVLHNLLEDDVAKPLLSKIFPGQTFTLMTDEDGHLHHLEQVIDETSSLVVKYIDQNYKAEIKTKPITTYVKYKHAVINDSLFNAAVKAEISQSITMELANIFAWDVDFSLDIRPGDRFSVLYEERYVDGEKISPGNILAAEFVTQGRIHQAIRYENTEGIVSYFNPDGRSMRKAFLRSPVKFTRISSHFNPGRKHPILHTIRAHNGVDYAAPTGTPVKAAGDGKVTFKGICGGYGNMVMIQHGRNYTTLYAHLHGFAKGVRKGTKVRQGQVIGYVGSTGLATGPHLHYEFRIDGKHQNPLTVKLPAADPIRAEYKDAFLAHADSVLRQMDHHHKTEMARLENMQHRMLD